MAKKYTAREYAEEMQRLHGSDKPVTWLTIGELVDLYELVHEDREQDEIEHIAEDERDHRDTIQSILSSMHPY